MKYYFILELTAFCKKSEESKGIYTVGTVKRSNVWLFFSEVDSLKTIEVYQTIYKAAVYLKREYKKNDPFIYQELLERQGDAIRNARRLLAEYNPPNPAQDNPSTTVHLLVEALNRYAPENLRRPAGK